MSDEYSDLWGDLLGASGQIIQSGSSYVGTGMFTWPFESTQTITSRFGTRVDPISGEVKTHGVQILQLRSARLFLRRLTEQ